MNLLAILQNLNKENKKMDKMAKLLQTTPEALEEFEHAYNSIIDDKDDTLFGTNAKQASAQNRTNIPDSTDYQEQLTNIINRATEELLAVKDGDRRLTDFSQKKQLLTNDDFRNLPKGLRPQLTGNLVSVDFATVNYPLVFESYLRFKKTGDAQSYHIFRQGLDILDLDPVLYETLGLNPNSMGYWFPAIKVAAEKHGFFKIPETKIIKVPLPILQLTRMDYFSLTPTTLKIVNDFCMKAFNLDVHKNYFIKTGVFSSKYDFRNAKVAGEKEVTELGEYLLFINWQTVQMAQPLTQPSIYGAATTNEWVVREFIEDTENNPCIYKGLPLHTEYRIFVDFDSDEILGISPYWEPETMKKRFSQGASEGSPHDAHDYIIYKAHEPVLMQRYEENKDRLLNQIRAMLPDVRLPGQWAIDIMQNGNDFWLIDMSTANTSALKECVPAGKLKKTEENWIPSLPKTIGDA